MKNGSVVMLGRATLHEGRLGKVGAYAVEGGFAENDCVLQAADLGFDAIDHFEGAAFVCA